MSQNPSAKWEKCPPFRQHVSDNFEQCFFFWKGGAKMYYFMLLREAAQYQFCSLHNYCSKGMQISKGLLDIIFTSNWHKIDIKRLFKGRIV